MGGKEGKGWEGGGGRRGRKGEEKGKRGKFEEKKNQCGVFSNEVILVSNQIHVDAEERTIYLLTSQSSLLQFQSVTVC